MKTLISEEMKENLAKTAEAGQIFLHNLQFSKFFEELAVCYRMLYDELREEGFSEEQAMEILTNTELTPEAEVEE